MLTNWIMIFLKLHKLEGNIRLRQQVAKINLCQAKWRTGGGQLWLCGANQIDWREGIIILIIFCWDKNALISLICKQKFVTLSLLSVAHCRLSIINNTDNNKNFIHCPINHTFGSTNACVLLKEHLTEEIKNHGRHILVGLWWD